MTLTPTLVYILQADLIVKESQIVDLQENIKTQRSETSKAKNELATTLAEMEKLNKNFKADEAGWEAEKSALLKREEEAETALKPGAEELAGLKNQINAMPAAIFSE